MTCRNLVDDIKTGVENWSRDEPGGSPAYWPGGVRHEGGVSPVCGFYTERGKAVSDTDHLSKVARGSAPSGRNREALSTDAESAGGPTRSSDDARVMAGTAKGSALPGCFRSSNRPVWLGGIGR
jgi:hypothetical protein